MIHAYDDLVRQTKDAVTLPQGGEVDDFVLAITRAYDSEGRKAKITSWSDAAASGTVRNEVSTTHNGFGGPLKEYQEHEGAVGGDTVPPAGMMRHNSG